MDRGCNYQGGWIDEIDIATGRRVPWKEVRLADSAGALLTNTLITPDGRAYAYTMTRILSTLYLAEGLR